MSETASDKTRERLARSLTAESTGLIDFLPYLLQDLWQLGGSPTAAACMVQKHLPGEGRFLDLACGKGAVTICVAQQTGWQGKGVDILPEFITEAHEKAVEYGAAPLCSFAVGDVNEAVKVERGYDAVIFSAAGDVLGAPDEMLTKLAGVVKPGGAILLDDSYLKEGVDAADIRYQNYEYLHEADWAALFAKHGLRVLETYHHDEAEAEEGNESDMMHITRRAAELAEKFPGKKAMFDGYVKSQQAEVEDVENDLENVLWVLQTPGGKEG